MSQPTVDRPDIDENEAQFRRVMHHVAEQAWALRIADETLAALYHVLNNADRAAEPPQAAPPYRS